MSVTQSFAIASDLLADAGFDRESQIMRALDQIDFEAAAKFQDVDTALELREAILFLASRLDLVYTARAVENMLLYSILTDEDNDN